MRYTGMTVPFVRDMALGLHDLAHDTLMIALFESRDSLRYDMEFYDPNDGECVGPGYLQGGLQILPSVGYPTTEGQMALACRFDRVEWPNLTLTVGGAVIYNETSGNRAIACIDFGTHLDKVNDKLILNFPLTSDPLIYIKHPAIVIT